MIQTSPSTKEKYNRENRENHKIERVKLPGNSSSSPAKSCKEPLVRTPLIRMFGTVDLLEKVTTAPLYHTISPNLTPGRGIRSDSSSPTNNEPFKIHLKPVASHSTMKRHYRNKNGCQTRNSSRKSSGKH